MTISQLETAIGNCTKTHTAGRRHAAGIRYIEKTAKWQVSASAE